MSWPRCPECGSERVPLFDGRPAKLEDEVLYVRSYRCPCGWCAITYETIGRVHPDGLQLRRKYPPVSGPSDKPH